MGDIAHISKFNGRVRTRSVKRASRHLIESFYQRLTFDFDKNKRIIDEVAEIHTKRLRNKIAGYTTHLMRRMQHNVIRGISLKLKEDESEKFMDSLPETSNINIDNIEVDKDTMLMLRAIGMGDLDGVSVRQIRKKAY